MGLVAYRDIGDDYVTKTFDLTTDIQDLYANLLELQGARRRRLAGKRQRGARRRASPSSPGRKGRKSAASCSWSATRRRTWTTRRTPNIRRCSRMARERDIIVNAVQAGDARDTERVWREIAQRGDGRYIPIPQDGGQIVVIETPVRRRDHHPAERDQRHRDALRPAPALRQRREQDPADRRVAAAAPASPPTWRATSTSARKASRRGGDRRRRSGRRRRRRPQQARCGQGRRTAGQPAQASTPPQRAGRAERRTAGPQRAERQAGGAGEEARRLCRRRSATRRRPKPRRSTAASRKR